MLSYVVFVGEKRAHAAKLQDTFSSVQHRKLVDRHEILAELLIVHIIRVLLAAALARVKKVDRLLPERLTEFSQRRLLRTAKEEP